jgi:subtilisin family serine protease
VIDEGFNQHDTHEALVPALPAPGRRRDFVEGDTVVTDSAQPGSFSHGTWTFGVLAANRPGTYVGAAFGAEFALARTEVHGSEQPTEMLYWAQAAEWADSLGADLISSSLGYFQFDDPFPDYTYADMDGETTDITRAARIAAARGILVVNSVGNEGNKPWHWLVAPADVNGDSLIAVGAVDASGFAAPFSSYGPTADGRVKPDLAARGVNNPLVGASGGSSAYTTADGTSFSAPLVAGLAACLWQARPSWTATEVIRALRETASRAGSPNDRIGYGLPNGASALCWRVDGSTGAPNSARVLGPNPMVKGGPPVRVRLMAGGVQSGRLRAHVRVFDARGREVSTLWSGELTRGQCLDVAWTGLDSGGRRAPPGIYYIALSAGGDVTSARIVSLQ